MASCLCNRCLTICSRCSDTNTIACLSPPSPQSPGPVRHHGELPGRGVPQRAQPGHRVGDLHGHGLAVLQVAQRHPAPLRLPYCPHRVLQGAGRPHGGGHRRQVNKMPSFRCYVLYVFSWCYIVIVCACMCVTEHIYNVRRENLPGNAVRMLVA